MILENKTKEELIDILKKELICIKEDYKTLKKGEWYRGWQECDSEVVLIDDSGNSIELIGRELCNKVLCQI